MLYPPDYHMHTPLCRHASGEPREYAARAVALGLREIGFSDHNPMPRDDFDDWRMRNSDLAGYVDQVKAVSQEFPQLVVKLGLEVDYIPGYEDWVRELWIRYPWDYFIGSVHYVSSDWAIDNPQRISEWKRREAMEVWSVYFQRLTMAAESGLFQIIGHADLCKKFSFYPKEDCAPIFKKFLQAAARHDVAIELNTAGLRKECREMYPSGAILTMACEAGVSITFGSDAHAAAEVGMNFGEAAELARAAGYTRYRTFARGQYHEVSLP